MTEIPKFETICDLFEQKPNAWEKVRPYLHLALMLAPGALFGSFGTLVGTLGALDSGLTLSSAVELLENTLFRSRKQVTYDSPYDLPRLANTMVIFAAWFDTVAEHAPVLWENLELDEAGWQWMQNECQDEYRHVQELVGGDGRNILTSNYTAADALERLYRLLADKTRKIAMGLSATEHLPINWDALPAPAVNKYFRYSEILERYENYYKWVHKQESTQYQPSREPGKLHLPASSSLLKSGLFRGRGEDLAQIERTFAEQDIVVLTGLGGMGKTELSIAYAARQPDTSGVFFLPFQGSFRDTIARAAMEGLAEYANQKLTTEEAFPIAWNLLLKCRKDDLLILDNVDTSVQTLNAVIKELGKLPMRCLVTTRRKSAGAIEVGKLSEEELLQIFDDNEAPVGREDRLLLINAVDRHTLTVSLIAQTLQGGMVNAKTILDALEKQNFDDISLPEVDAHFPGAEEQKKIYGHLRTVFRVSNMSDGARLAMTCAVLLPQGGMDADTFQSALDKEAAEALFSLSRNGWLNWHVGLISIHPVIRLVCKNELKPTDEICAPFLEQMWNQRDPNQYDKMRYRQLAELFETASNYLEDTQGYWSHRTGYLLVKLGKYHRALTYSLNALDIQEKILSEGHPALAASYTNVGIIYDYLGNRSKALEFQLKFLHTREKTLCEGHPDLALSYNNVGTTYGNLGNSTMELTYLLKALEIQKETIHEDYPFLALLYNNLGGAYCNLGEYNKALELQLKSLDIRERILPKDHPDLATSYSDVGHTYGQLHDHRNALEFQLKALGIRESVLPKDHPDLATSYSAVSYTYGILCEHHKAMEFQLKAIAIQKEVLSNCHPDLAVSYNNMGSLYSKIGDHNTALIFTLKSLEIREKVLPKRNSDTAASYNNVGACYGNLGNHKMALNYLLKALEIQEELLPTNHPTIASSCCNIAINLGKMNRYTEAVPYIQRAVTIGELSLLPDDPSLSNYRQGKQMLERCAELQEKGIDFPTPFL